MRLDRWLVSQRTEQTRARIQKFIDAGYVRVNGKTSKAKTPLRQGDEVQLGLPTIRITRVRRDLRSSVPMKLGGRVLSAASI